MGPSTLRVVRSLLSTHTHTETHTEFHGINNNKHNSARHATNFTMIQCVYVQRAI